MSSAIDKLVSLFDKRDVIFWYDESGEFQNEISDIKNGIDVYILDNNEFSIKYNILKAKKGSKALIYSSSAKKEDSKNWLFDLELRGYLFSADKASMIMSDLGIELQYKPFIQNHISFFGAKSRLEKFVKLFEKGDDTRAMALKMMAVVLKCEAILEDIVIKLLSDDDLFKEIIKYNLDEPLWQELKSRFGYDEENPTIKDFGFKLLQNHFYYCVDRQKCSLNKEAYLFVKSWMDSSSNKDRYIKLSKEVEDELSIKSMINGFPLQSMLECDTYEVCEQFIISHLKKMVLDEAKKDLALDICETREHKFWYESYKNIYLSLKFGVKIIDSIKNNTFKIDSLDSGIREYAENFYKIDSYYRKYTFHSSKSEHTQILKEIDEYIENVYLNDFLRVINDMWQLKIKKYQHSSLTYQKDFYNHFVEPILAKKQKVFVVISDALRYECGVEFCDRVLGLNRFDASIEPIVGVLPSYTQLGIASLLPHKSLVFGKDNDSVIVDGLSSQGSQNRDTILKKANPKSTYIDSESFMSLKGVVGKSFVRDYEVIYIYHNEIDATGDKMASESRVFDAVESSLNTLERLIKQIANFNGTNIFVTSDHGFLYQNSATKESEFCSVAKPKDAKRVNRRFIIAKEVEPHKCLDIFEAKEFFINGDEKIALAKSINKIKIQGGGHRFVHGGATLQEMVVPLIFIKKRRKDDVKEVTVSMLPISQITTNSVVLSFYQEEPISQKVKPLTLKIALYSPENNILSNTQKYRFDSEDSYERNREVKLKFDLKQIASEYSGKNIKLIMKKIIENSTEEPIYKEYDVRLQLSFANDFDDF